MKAFRLGRLSAVAVVAAGALALSACGSDNATGTQNTGSASSGPKVTGTLTGTGSSAQAQAIDAWKQGFTAANSGVTVQYSPDGSGAGRKTFISGASQFAGTDAAMKPAELDSAKAVCGPDGALDLPVYISPIALTYNLQGVKDLNLTPDTVAKIFRGEITNWNDPAIAADNKDAKLPDLKITPVHRSDDSGTTENFTDYLSKAAPNVWKDKSNQTWPASLPGENAKGTTGVVKTVSDTPGAFAYADDSAVTSSLGKAKVKVGDKFVALSAEGAAKAVELSKPAEGRAANDLALTLDRTPTDSSAYPIVLVSYHVVCTTYKDQATVDLVKAWENYVVSDAGQKAAASAAKSAPLSSALASKAKTAIDSIKVKS
ncbi:phosphate-binding protein PstS [Sinomonas cellulolyticus]|uniref:Phosphate-binding protein n=1 Tax=Sinomonas cellulolyticus TaxID=2801916 RepID=A0ABS1K6W7_9MICC|nr:MULTISPECIES: phosphate ABC transporter substrate-binding protein PstS [Sinomonas]MBL0706632.1 phosphate ABC transporter substrate-binding protein PstS [Sinomonas cellulolyticus]GHG60432.1 phosphate-binding protein PstS [Sinomonas sp. KCTC 49339]